MNYSIKILKADRYDFTILGESLSFYVEKESRSAFYLIGQQSSTERLDFLTPIENNQDGCVLVLRNNTPLLEGLSMIRILTFHEDFPENKIRAPLYGPDEAFFIVTTDTLNKITEQLEEKENFDEFAEKLKVFAGRKLKSFMAEALGGKGRSSRIIPLEFQLEAELRIVTKKELMIIDSCAKLDYAAKTVRKRINRKHMHKGVRFTDSAAAYIGPRVKIGEGSVIMPGSIIEGRTVIGQNCVIGPNTRLVNMKIGSSCTISNSAAFDSTVGDGSDIGPFAYIRPRCDIGNRVKIGDFVEVKNAVIGDNTKASHLTYIGDADLGERVNMGCGTITANYDGNKKSRTIIEDDVFIGSNSNLIAPVTVKKGAFVAAGSTITDEVPADSLAIARVRQIIKTAWKRKV